MGTDFVAESAEARRLFDAADDITGLPIKRLCAEGPIERLTATEVAQPAVVVTSLAGLAVLRSKLKLDYMAVAGHSVGEYAACVAADVFDAETALKLVHKRAQAMAAVCSSVDGSMAAVIGLDEKSLRQVCEAVSENGSSVQIANFNAPGNLIVSGERGALERLTVGAKAAGARRVLPLNVDGPFHSAYMRPAAGAVAHALEGACLARARVAVVLNASAEPARSPDALRLELAEQVYSPVRWIETLLKLAAMGCDRFLEVGPGSVLAGLVRRTLQDVKVASFGSIADLEAAQAVLTA
jgi:[acyl-carrier-protein] S-malonyltransferase